jgi:hypothetical protein
MITDWIVEKLEPALERMARKRHGPQELVASTRGRDEVLHDCDTIRLSIIHVSNGTLLRMDTHRHDDYNIAKGTRNHPNVVIIKDDETIQDAVVRMLAIAQLERP